MYDEDRELTRYILNHYPHLLTGLELRVTQAIRARAKSAEASSPNMAEMLNRRWGAPGDCEVEAALAAGPEAYERKIRDRLLAEHAAVVIVNRCRRCERVVRTPQARQCFWCGFEWHDSEAESDA